MSSKPKQKAPKTEIHSAEKTLENKDNSGEEAFLDQALRPSVWDDYIGQKNIKENLSNSVVNTPWKL